MGIFGKTISIRWSLLRSFTILILVSSLTVLMLMTIRARQTEKDLSEKLITTGTRQATEELDRFFQPVNINALIAARWGLSGKLNLAGVVKGPAGKLTAGQLAAVTRINTLLMPLMRLFPEMSSLQVANARGDGFLIIRLDSGRIRNRVVSREGWGTRTLWFDLDQEGRPQSPEWREVDYEPRSRAWYAGLKDLPDEEVFWTEPYLFFTTKDLGITASVKWQDRGMEYVFAIDVLLTSITDFTRRDTTQLSKRSQTAVYTRDWRVVGLPRHQKFQDQEAIRRALLLPIDEIQIPELHAAVKMSSAHKEISQQIRASGKGIFSYESQDETWWAGVTSYPLGKRRQLWIGILVPNDDLLEGITQLRMHIMAATLVTLLAALAYSFLLARSYSRPLEALAAQSRRISDLDFQADEKIEAKLFEFKQLSEAQAQSLTALQSFSRYVPIEIVKELMAKGEVARIGGTRKPDDFVHRHCRFHQHSETMSPEALTKHLAGYFQAMIDALHHHGATVDKIVGDAIVAFWGAPTAMPDQTDRALKAVLECRDTLNSLESNLGRPGLAGTPDPLRFGHRTGGGGQYGGPDPIGLHGTGGHGESGQPPGSPEQGLRYRHTGGYRHPAGRWGDGFAMRHLDRIIVAGKTQATDIFELLGETGQVPAAELAAARRYEAAWDQYRAGEFRQAGEALAGFEAEFGVDPAVERLRQICQAYRERPPGPDWDGIFIMTTK